MLTNLELFHACGRIGYARWEQAAQDGKVWSLESELRDVRWENNNQYDAVMALALALWPLRRESAIVIGPRVGRIERQK